MVFSFDCYVFEIVCSFAAICCYILGFLGVLSLLVVFSGISCFWALMMQC